MGEDGGGSTSNHATGVVLTHRRSQRQCRLIIWWRNRTRPRRSDPTASESERTTTTAPRGHQPTGKQARHVEIVVLPLWETETHLGDLLQTGRISRLVGRTAEGESFSSPSENGGRCKRRRGSPANRSRKPWGIDRSWNGGASGASTSRRQREGRRKFGRMEGDKRRRV